MAINMTHSMHLAVCQSRFLDPRHLPVQKVAWQEVKGQQVLVGSYEEAVKAMNDMGFLSTLVNFPKEAINDETVELLQPYFAASVRARAPAV